MSGTARVPPQKEAIRLSNMLRHVLGKERFPVDVAALAKEVSKNNVDPIEKIVGGNLPGFEGMLRRHRKRPEWHIIYNEHPRYKGRVRFTVAHEFGHYQLHRPQLIQDDYDDGELQKSCSFECKPLHANAWQEAERKREEEADTFASFLLMPLDDYREQVAGHEMTGGLLKHVTNRYGVSLTAACLKWIDFTESRAAMIVSRDGFSLWGRASKSALKSGVYVKTGMPIPDNALAVTKAVGSGFVNAAPVDQPSGIWSFSDISEPVRELAMVSEFLDISITILQFDAVVNIAEIEEEEPWDAFDQFNAGGQFRPDRGVA